MSTKPGMTEVKYRRRNAWRHLLRGEPLNALCAAYSAWQLYRFVRGRPSS